MKIKNTDGNRKLKRAVTNLALENMYVSKKFLTKLLKVSADNDYENLINETINQHKKQKGN